MASDYRPGRPFPDAGFPRIPADEMKALGRAVRAGNLARAALLDPGLDLPTGDRSRLDRVARAGDDARRRLIEGNLGLAIGYGSAVARLTGSDAGDLISESFVGLIRGADEYDPDAHGTVFSTFARWKIRGSVAHARKREGSRRDRGVGWGGCDEYGDVAELPEPRPGPTEAVAEGERGADAAGALRGMLGSLDPRSRRIVEQRHGLAGGRPMTLEAIGRDLGITKERVRQLEAEAIERMRWHARGRKVMS